MTIVIATGGTGGHFFPALHVAREFKRRKHKVIFVGAFRKFEDYVKVEGFEFELIKAQGLIAKGFLDRIVGFFLMIGAIFKSMILLWRIKPDRIIGFGGYGSFPAVFAGIILCKPTFIHEQNVIPGKANLFLSRYVKRIAISFPQAEDQFPSKAVEYTGCPCLIPSKNINQADIYQDFKLDPQRKTILLVGGSQGSRRINNIYLESLKHIGNEENVQSIHVCGAIDYENCQNQYNLLGIPFALFPFLDKMKEAYSIADLVICRAGAVTVSEIIHFNLPAVLLPYPHAKGHQLANANVLASSSAIDIIKDVQLSPSALTESIRKLLNSNQEHYAVYARYLKPDAAERIADMVTE